MLYISNIFGHFLTRAQNESLLRRDEIVNQSRLTINQTLLIVFYLMAAALLPLFWVPLGVFGSFRLDINLIGFLLLLSIVPFTARQNLITFGHNWNFVIGCIFFISSFIAIDFIEYRGEIIRLLMFQLAFFLVALQFGVLTSLLLNTFSIRWLRWLIVATPGLSFMITLIAQSGIDAILQLLIYMLQFNGDQLVMLTRKVFWGDWVEILGYTQAPTSPNRVAQHLFGMAIAVFGVLTIFRAGPRQMPLLFILLFVLVIYPIVLRSGQVILQMSIIAFFVLMRYLRDFGLGRALRFIYFVLLTFLFFAILVYDTPAIQDFVDRINGENFTTGRDKIFETVVHGNYFNIITGFEHDRIDTHSFYLTMVGYFGLIGLCFLVFLTFYLFLIMRFFMRLAPLHKDDLQETLLLGVLASLPLQLIAVMSVNGGFGMPSWPEFYKISALFAYLHYRMTRKDKSGNNFCDTPRPRSGRGRPQRRRNIRPAE